MAYMTWRAEDKTWGAWFRIFGYGLCISTSPLLFSERYGYTRILKVGNVKVKLLTPYS